MPGSKPNNGRLQRLSTPESPITNKQTKPKQSTNQTRSNNNKKSEEASRESDVTGDEAESDDAVNVSKKPRVRRSSGTKLARPGIGGVPVSVQASFDKLQKRLGAPSNETTPNSGDEQAELTPSKVEKPVLEYVQGLARTYGVVPKMMRMQIVFEYMWYLAYGYDGRTNPLSATSLDGDDFDSSNISGHDSQSETNPFLNSKSNSKRSPKVYRDEVNWKMFIPPLPKHSGYENGWVLISDALLAMPLSIFVQIITINYKIESLNSYLQHPKKRHLLLRHLPSSMRQQLLIHRKYIFCFHEICARLCYMGLVSFGPHQFKEKDQVFIFVHRKGMIKDTTTSDPHYNLVSLNKDYNVTHYDFVTQQIVEKFWFDLQCICLNTPLGMGRGLRTANGDWPILETLDTKKQLKEYLEPLFPSINHVSCVKIPGDGLGAGGLDSSFYAHMKRNWTWTNLDSDVKAFIEKIDVQRSTKKKRLHKEVGNQSRDSSLATDPNDSAIVSAHPNQRLAGISGRNEAKLSRDDESVTSTAPPTSNSFEVHNASELKAARRGGRGLKRSLKHSDSREGTPPKKVPKFRKIRPKKVKTPYYDEEDRLALKRMTKERVDWSTTEDSLLLLCRVTSSFMDDRKQMIVPWPSIRDILHKHIPVSNDKTSKACQRRLNYVLKNSQTALNVAVFLGEALQDTALVREFRNRKYKISDQETVIATFQACLERMRLKFKNSSLLEQTANSLGGKDQLPQSKDDLLRAFDVKVSSGNLYIKSSHSDVTNLKDVYNGVLHNLIHSTMSLDDKTGRSYELFKLFSQYPEQMLHSVFNNMRRDQIISKMKTPSLSGARRRRTSLTLPFTALNYHFSQRYIYTFLSRYPVEVFYQSYNLLHHMINSWQKGDPLDKDKGMLQTWDNGGSCALVVTLMALEKIDFEIEIPEQIIVVDTNTMKQDVVRRGKLLKQVGRKSASDDEDDELLEKLLPKQPNQSGGSSVESSSAFRSQDPPRMSKVRFVDELQKRTLEDNFAHASFDPHASRYDVNARQASRINLALARNMSFRDINIRDINPQDNIVVNACTVKITPNHTKFDLETVPSCSIENCRQRQKKSKSKSLPHLPSAPLSHIRDPVFLKHDLRNSMIQQELDTVPATVCDVESLIKGLKKDGLSEKEVEVALSLCQFLQAKECLGAKMTDIYSQFPSLTPADISNYFHDLKQYDWVLQVGVTEARYVHHEHRRPWLIHSYKNVKGRGIWINENEKEIPFTDKVLGLLPDSQLPSTSNLDKASRETSPTPNSESLPQNQDEKQKSPKLQNETSPDSLDPEAPKRSLRVRKKSLSSSSSLGGTPRPDSPSADKDTGSYGSGTYVRVNLVSRPWRKPDGHLNRPVLYMMLRSILMYVMSFPGAPFSAISSKLSPTVQPIAVQELLDMLFELNCVKRIFMHCSHSPSLFSKPMAIEPLDAPLDGREMVVYEPRVDCILRLGQLFPELSETSATHMADTVNMFYERSTKDVVRADT